MKFDAGFVLLTLSLEKSHLSEFLADAGIDVVEGQWGLPAQMPLVVVTDDFLTITQHPPLVHAVEKGLIGVVAIEIPETRISLCPPDQLVGLFVADVFLPGNVTGRELATAVRLVAKIATLRRQQSNNANECQRWIELAMHDPLTGLPNRRNWEIGLQQAMAEPQCLSIAMVDVDFFKQINDVDGHAMGDMVLREVAFAMRSQLRRGDFVARLGGDEFGLLIPNISADEAEVILDRLREHVSSHLASLNLPAPTLSAGLIYLAPDDPRDAAEVMSAASQSLRSAKQRNRNCTVTRPARQSQPAV